MRCWGEPKSFKLIFSATQRCNILATLFRIVTTLFQHCNAVLRKESSFRIVSCNITTDINTAVSLKSNVAKIYLSFQVNFALPSKSILLFQKKKKILHFRSPQNISMVAMLLSLFPNIKNSDL